MPEIYPFLIVEDQEIIAENLRRIIVQLGYPNPYLATSYPEAIEIIKNNEVSLLLLDIFLKKDSKDGIDLIKEVHQNKMIPHIFVTANADKATLDRAKLTNPFGYVVKPFDKNNIFSNIEMALFNISKNTSETNRLKYINKGQKEYLEIDYIQYIKSDGVYLEIINDTDKKILIRSTFKEIESELPNHFVQIHKSVMINCKKIDSYSGTKVKVCEQELSIGRSHKKEFLEKISAM